MWIEIDNNYFVNINLVIYIKKKIDGYNFRLELLFSDSTELQLPCKNKEQMDKLYNKYIKEIYEKEIYEKK